MPAEAQDCQKPLDKAKPRPELLELGGLEGADFALGDRAGRSALALSDLARCSGLALIEPVGSARVLEAL